MTKVRIVELSHLAALCEEVSDPLNRFWVEKETKSRVWVGHDDGSQVTYALFPSYSADHGEHVYVSLYIMRLINEFFDALDDYPERARPFDRILEGPRMEKASGRWRRRAQYFYTEV